MHCVGHGGNKKDGGRIVVKADQLNFVLFNTLHRLVLVPLKAIHLHIVLVNTLYHPVIAVEAKERQGRALTWKTGAKAPPHSARVGDTEPADTACYWASRASHRLGARVVLGQRHF